ncbi:aminodeoxychorismate synthase component I [Sphingomonas sp.]|jgi:para-aminobenzoate synthetase/4-amino-4-deoxychorismate lyase|uniref:aminodeoxychorismate synthase component I n=1 Tax=Sphingomonas sp. TaxID=28214 RepID=UPI002ED93B8B
MLAALPVPFVLLDDARDAGAPARLYHAPRRILVAYSPDEVRGVLDDVRAATRDGLHAAGFLAYEAGEAFEPHVGTLAPPPTPLAWFGLFDGFETIEDVPAHLPDPAGAWIGALSPEITRDTYDEQLAEVAALIAAGDVYQANLTFRARVPFLGDPLALYARLRTASRAGWGAVVNTGTQTLLSLSPELFFALDSGHLTCRPMKGTAARDANPGADRVAAAALAADAKQRAENLMIVDLMRNDLSRVASPGSVAVPALFAIEQYPTVHQMTSTVTAALGDGKDAVDVLAALFPCGSITGAPKVRAMQAIATIEGSPRGAYCGAIGKVDANGDAQFNVAIRTLTIHPAEDHATIGLGSGIVADSEAQGEWEEAHDKGAFLHAGARAFDLIETMRFDPEDGTALLELHLARMGASAQMFGYAFDRHAARNELQAATFRLRDRRRVRLLLSASGALAVEVAPVPSPPAGPVAVAIVPLPVATSDFRLRHKTSDRGFYDTARGDAFEVVFEAPDGTLTEGSFTSLFVARGGVLVTPPAGALLPGVLRAELLASGRAIEGVVTRADLRAGFFIGNALRGLIPAIVSDGARSTGSL